MIVQMVLIMDEVDGMSAGDRGGVADLIQTLKGAKLPIICICNDKYNQKLKSLRNHCLELDYRSAPIPACLTEGEVAPCMPGSQAAAIIGILLTVLCSLDLEDDPDKHGLWNGAMEHTNLPLPVTASLSA